ncbi:MAG: hypothetical protein FD126_451 [Elusimicrobia bacterium]|nr:MAG: hypothetical protein FD126_451 [Elusimicrobiota bacterium]
MKTTSYMLVTSPVAIPRAESPNAKAGPQTHDFEPLARTVGWGAPGWWEAFQPRLGRLKTARIFLPSPPDTTTGPPDEAFSPLRTENDLSPHSLEAPPEARTSSAGVTNEAAAGVSPWPPATWCPMTPTRPGASRRETRATATRETGDAELEAEGATSSGAAGRGACNAGTGKGVREREAAAAGREFAMGPTGMTGTKRMGTARGAAIC